MGRTATVRRDVALRVDDGQLTDLAAKGDGVKSLAALSLVRSMAAGGDSGASVLLAVEEPESHLHAGAVHGVASVLRQIATRQQVIVTTHSGVLANAVRVSSNVIVKDNVARPARSIVEVREALGIQIQDNPASARVVLLVEGTTDVESIGAIIGIRDARLRSALESRMLVVVSLGGASRLLARAQLYSAMAARVVAFLDNDDAGRDAMRAAVREGLLSEADIVLATCPGKRDAELEDLLDPLVFAEALRNRFGVTLTHLAFRRGRAKWSDRMRRLFEHAGKVWDSDACSLAKAIVRDAVIQSPELAIRPSHQGPLDTLTASLLRALD
jgi:hypothetical protein